MVTKSPLRCNLYQHVKVTCLISNNVSYMARFRRRTYSFKESRSVVVVVEDDTDVRVFINHIGLTEELIQL